MLARKRVAANIGDPGLQEQRISWTRRTTSQFEFFGHKYQIFAAMARAAGARAALRMPARSSLPCGDLAHQATRAHARVAARPTESMDLVRRFRPGN